MPAIATAAPKPAASKSRSTLASRAPAKSAGPKPEASSAPSRASAPQLPVFARSALAPQTSIALRDTPAKPLPIVESKPAPLKMTPLPPVMPKPANVHGAAHQTAPKASQIAAPKPIAPKTAPPVPAAFKPAGTHAAAHETASKASRTREMRAIAAPKPIAPKTAPAARATFKPAGSHAAAPKPRPTLAPLAPAKHGITSGGQPLPSHIQEAIQNSLMVDLSSVRLHASTAAQRQASAVSARAFTFGNDIYLGHGEHPTDLTLISHEAAHVIQQQSRPAVQKWSFDRNDRYEREADQAAAAVQRKETFSVRERVDSPRVQRLGISDALNFFADAANNIPGYRMFTIVLGVNPINMQQVERSPANVLRAVVEFIPGGALITQALDKYGVFDKVGNWVQDQLDTLAMTGSSIKKALMDFLDSLSWTDIFHLGDVWDRAKHIFSDPIDRIKNFVKGFLEGIWKFVRDAILKPIAKLAEGTSGWDLLIAVMGKNPITGEAVPRTPDTLIGGFMKLIHEDEIWNNLKKANAVSRAWAWFQGVLSGLMGFVSQIPDLFVQALKSLEWTDIINLPSGFMKVASVFGKFLGNFISWAGGKVWDLLQIIFEVVAPAVMPYLKKVGAAFKSILKNPIGFVRNLIAAGKLGFVNFGSHFLTHLKAGLIDWLTGSLPGVYIPKAISLPEVGKFAMSVLGITWAQIRAKLVKALGPNGEKIMTGLETAFDVVVALVKGGPAAAWELIKEKLTNLKDMVIDGITSFVVDTIVKKAVPKIISMFIPGAGFISAIISIYDTVMVFVEKLAKLAAAVKAFVDSIVAIAAGQIEGAANKVENTLAGLLSLAISFLAGFLGLGNIASKVLAVIEKIRAAVDKALDVAIAWVVGKAKALFAKLFGKGEKPDDRTDEQKKADLAKAMAEAGALQKTSKITEADIRKGLVPIKQKYRMESLELIVDKEDAAKETVHVVGKINPDGSTAPTDVPKEAGDYNVHKHIAPAPKEGAKGESHHVPVKVFKRWIGEILEIAGNAMVKTGNVERGEAVRGKGTEYKDDTVGEDLSAIWLSEEAHASVHESAKPGEFDKVKGDFVVKTADGETSTRPMRGTIARTVHGAVVDQDTSKADDKASRNREIYEAKANQLPSLFQSVFEKLLAVGITLVVRAKLKDEKWRTDLPNLARRTWAKYFKLPG
jgi:hypothetical protein